jgi:hypothetical protein
VPQCGALSSLQKTPHYRGGDPAETAARLNVKLWVLVTALWLRGILPLKKTNTKYSSFRILLKNEKGIYDRSITVLGRGNAHYRAKHAVTRLPRQRCRRPSPRSCAAGANGTNMCRWWSAFAPRKPDIITLPRCTFAESFTSGCNSVAALALASCYEHVAEEIFS